MVILFGLGILFVKTPTLRTILGLNKCQGIGCGRISTYGPGPYIAKTKSDYSKYVWIGMSTDKKMITSYPGPTDVNPNREQIVLHNGYYINSFAWGSNNVPIDVTIVDYAKMNDTLSLKQMEDLILDKNPYVELYDCGENYAAEFSQSRSDPLMRAAVVNKLNEFIDNNSLDKTCDKLI